MPKNKLPLTLLALELLIMNLYISIFLLLISSFFTACAPKQDMLKADSLIATGKYKQAAAFTESKIDIDDKFSRNNLLWSLQNGSANFFAKDENRSIKQFDNSEFLIKHYRERVLAKNISDTFTSTLLNDTTRPYMGTQYDGIMANTYKAIDYMKLGDKDAARVEFNRAIDRQRRAKIYFNDIIQKEQKAIKEKEKESLEDGKNIKVSDSVIDRTISQNYPSLKAYKPYPNFVNPMSTYLAALFARADDSEAKAYTLFKEALGMMPQNHDVKDDYNNNRSKEMVWVIFENGQAPVLKELRMDFPLWIFSNKLSYVSVALPKLVERKQAYTHLNVKLDNNQTIQTKFLSSMDRVIKTEFEKNYSSVVKRAILSTATKAAINYTIQENANQNSSSGIAAAISIAAAIYQIASTQADTRIWSTLPKEFQLARFSRPQDGTIDLLTPNNILIQNIELPQSDNTIIYVKIATPYALASVRVIPF